MKNYAMFLRKPLNLEELIEVKNEMEEKKVNLRPHLTKYRVVKTIWLTDDEFGLWANEGILEDKEWVAENKNLCTCVNGEQGVLEVRGADENWPTLLVDPQGYNYPRYVAIK